MGPNNELVPVAAPLVKLGAVTGHSRTQQREMFRAELQARDMSDEHVRTLLATVEKDSVEGAYWEHASWRHGQEMKFIIKHIRIAFDQPRIL